MYDAYVLHIYLHAQRHYCAQSGAVRPVHGKSSEKSGLHLKYEQSHIKPCLPFRARQGEGTDIGAALRVLWQALRCLLLFSLTSAQCKGRYLEWQNQESPVSLHMCISLTCTFTCIAPLSCVHTQPSIPTHTKTSHFERGCDEVTYIHS